MSRTPEIIKNKKAECFRNALIAIGILCGLATYGAYESGGNMIIPALLSVLFFYCASKVKVTWKKVTETSGYK